METIEVYSRPKYKEVNKPQKSVKPPHFAMLAYYSSFHVIMRKKHLDGGSALGRYYT